MAKVNTISVSSGKWDYALNYAKGFTQGFTEYYKNKFSESTGTGEDLLKMKEILDEGFDIMDKGNPLTYAKKPFKILSEKIDSKVSDGNPETMTAGEKIWNGIKGSGQLINNITSAKGIIYGCLVAGSAGMAAGAIGSSIPASIKLAADVAGTAGGTALAGKGVYDVVTAENEKDAQKGGAEILAGGTLAVASASRIKGDYAVAQQEWIKEANAHKEFLANMSPETRQIYNNNVELCRSYGINSTEAEKIATYMSYDGHILSGQDIQSYLSQKNLSSFMPHAFSKSTPTINGWSIY